MIVTERSDRRRARIAGSPGCWPGRPWAAGAARRWCPGLSTRSVIHCLIWARIG